MTVPTTPLVSAKFLGVAPETPIGVRKILRKSQRRWIEIQYGRLLEDGGSSILSARKGDMGYGLRDRAKWVEELGQTPDDATYKVGLTPEKKEPGTGSGEGSKAEDR